MPKEPFPEVQMASMCDSCAYRAGTEANTDPFTTAKRETCENLGAAFLCHENRYLNGDLIPGEPPALCAGFVAAFKRRIDSGFYKQQSAEEKEKWRTASKALDYILESLAR